MRLSIALPLPTLFLEETTIDYAVIRVRNPASGAWELMSDAGRVIVFDTAAMAWEWLPLLGQGRLYQMDVARRRIWFPEVSATLPNMAEVVSPYDTGERTPWKRHIIWSEWWEGTGEQEGG